MYIETLTAVLTKRDVIVIGKKCFGHVTFYLNTNSIVSGSGFVVVRLM